MLIRIAVLRTRTLFVLCLFLMSSLTCAADENSAKPFEQKLEGTPVSFKMVAIPGGTFLMGSPATETGRPKVEAGKPDPEGPQHEVKVEPFYMEEHEVSWAEYNLFLNNYSRLSNQAEIAIPKDKLADAVTYPTPIYDLEAGPRIQRMGGKGEATPTYPAVIMSQYAARQYCKWLSMKTGRFYRLPSEAEWEYAARAGTKTAYYFGDDPSKLGDYAWFTSNSNESDGDTGVHKIMTKKPNPWGLYDMYGNVAEWCVDQYQANWYQKFAGKVTDAKDTINWANQAKTQYPRVLRGGSYDSEAAECRSAARLPSNPMMNNTDPQIPKSPHWMSDGFMIGFRVVSPVKEPDEATKHRWWDADDVFTENNTHRDRDRKEIVKPGAVEK